MSHDRPDVRTTFFFNQPVTVLCRAIGHAIGIEVLLTIFMIAGPTPSTVNAAKPEFGSQVAVRFDRA